MRIVQLTTDNREHFKDYGATEPYFGAAPQALLSGFAGLDNAEVHVISCVRQPVASPERLAGNVHYHPLLVGRVGWMSTAYQGCVREVRKLIRRLSPDIVHGQGTERDCAISAVYSGYPNVVTLHGNMAELQRRGMLEHRLYGRIAATLEDHVLRRSAGVFCNSEYTRELVSGRARKTWLVPNAIRGVFFDPPRCTRPADGIPQLVNIGVVSPRKRQLEILRSVGRLVEAGHRLRIVFVGSMSGQTDYGATFRAELAQAVAAGHAEFAGFLGEEDLAGLLDRSHGLIHFPSEEAFGLVVAEAMARGIKFFGSDLGGIRDIARDVPGAELHDRFDELEEAVARWLRGGAPVFPEAAEAMAARYAPRVVAMKHLEIYREVLGK